MKKLFIVIGLGLTLSLVTRAELVLPAVIGDHMVLQQKQADPIWGWDTPGATIRVSFADKVYAASVGTDGKWMVKLDPMPANATPQELKVVGTSTRIISDVLVGEVWVCSGQSNMEFILGNEWNGDLEVAAANLPTIRLLKEPLVGTQKPQNTFESGWVPSTPDSARKFSAVGFLFGRQIQQILNVPVGLIDNAWGGSYIEAWTPRAALENDPRFKTLMDTTRKHEAALLPDNGKAELAERMARWKAACLEAKKANEPEPWPPTDWLTGNERPGNIFAGLVHPLLGFGIRGVIWYQGESNVGHAGEYADLFPLMIEQWRKEWGQGDFPFFWVQLPNFGSTQAVPGDSDWAELREAQASVMKLPQTGQAVTIDLGEANNIHPKNKRDVAARLVRWALAMDYGMKIPYRSPEFQSLVVISNKALVTFNCFGSSLRPFGAGNADGFALCSSDHVWHWGKGRIVGTNVVEVTSQDVAAPIAVSYAWAGNPAANLFSKDGLPVTPFRMANSPQAWLTQVAAKIAPAESNLLWEAQSTLLGNIVKTNAWQPYRGIEPSISKYRGIWNWDSAFHAICVSQWDGDLAKEQLNIIFDRQLPNGMLPDVIWENGMVVTNCTKPPVMAWAVAVVDRRSPDLKFLQRIYPKLVRLEQFWLKERGGEGDGLFYYAGADAGYDSGWDNSVRWDLGYRTARADTHRLWAIDLNCYMYMHYSAMSFLAGRLGLRADQKTWDGKADVLAKLINEKLWDDPAGFYVDRDRTTKEYSPVLSPAGFMPLFINIAPKEHIERMAMVAASPEKFYPGIPTAAYDSAGFDATNMWRGPAWLNTSYFAIKGLKDNGQDRLAGLMRSTLLGWIERNPGSLREYYNPQNGNGLGAEKFGWSAVFTMAFILDWDNDNLTWLFSGRSN